jgi:hypothetical protein
MKIVLDGDIGVSMIDMHTIEENGEKLIYIQYEKQEKGKYASFLYKKYRWDSKTKMYEVYESGYNRLEEWQMN